MGESTMTRLVLRLPVPLLRDFRELCCQLFRDPHTGALPVPLEILGVDAAVAQLRTRLRLGLELPWSPATLAPHMSVETVSLMDDVALVARHAQTTQRDEQAIWADVVRDFVRLQPVFSTARAELEREALAQREAA